MSYRRESPCMKYYEKAKGDGLLRKSLSATRFPPIRRTSDPSSESGSDDFHQLDIGEDQSSSISRSSSESCHSLGSNRCQLRKLDEMRSSRSSLNKLQIFDDDFLYQNESLDEFRSRLKLRRSIKARDNYNYQIQENEGDKSDFSYDSTTKEAHEEILRNAESLRLEKAVSYESSGSSKKSNRSFKSMIRGISCDKRAESVEEQSNKLQEIDRQLDLSDSMHSKEETLHKLCLRRQEELRLASLVKRTSLDYEGSLHGLQRSSTDYFGQVPDMLREDNHQKSLSSKAKRIFSSPRLRRKTHSQVLRAASSIPSLIFPLKSNKSKCNINSDMLDSSNSNTPESFASSKKNSIDDGLICNTSKARRSPLRFLGNFVDDKLFRGRWGSTKRAKSSVELGRLAWEIPDDLTDNSIGNKKLNRRKSSNNASKDEPNKREITNNPRRLTIDESIDTTPKISGSIKRKPRSMSTSAGERTRNRIPSATSDRLSLSSSSAIGSDDADIFLPQQPLRTEISADALAEIEAFERLAQSLLIRSPSDK